MRFVEIFVAPKLDNVFGDDESGEVFKLGIRSWRELKKTNDFMHWLNVGVALVRAHDRAAEAAGASSGREFTRLMTEFLKLYPAFGEIDKRTRAFAVRCYREHEEIDKWRATLTREQALRLNHPQSTWRAFDNARHPRKPATSSPRVSAHEKLKQAYEELKVDYDGLCEELGRQEVRMSRKEWITLMKCLHPDQRGNATDADRDVALRALTAREKFLRPKGNGSK